tara:strand:+ start:138 stop:287 length:150 start_codon:yes stop_codon:yes gene_type:complete
LPKFQFSTKQINRTKANQPNASMQLATYLLVAQAKIMEQTAKVLSNHNG